MKQFTITEAEQEQRLTKYLARLLPNAGSGFLYKMLRKKNITLNGAKADGSETVKSGDVICLFFSDETFASFSGKPAEALPVFAKRAFSKDQIVFENTQVIIAFKPAGLLSQKDSSDSESVNEQLLQYLADKGELSPASLAAFKPSVCNRLDRNTSGLVVFAKTLQAGRELNRIIRERDLGKYYYVISIGRFEKPLDSRLYVNKDKETNVVTVSEKPVSSDSLPVHTEFVPVLHSDELTLLRVRLHTGRSHQIRSVLSYLGYPVLGDPKYASEADEIAAVQKKLRIKHHLHGQQLLAYALTFPTDLPECLKDLSGKAFYAPVPADFDEVLRQEFSLKGDYHAVLQIPRPQRFPV
ncbi:MAG: RluA family pseudouridine synthase [Lachnospiraceae bacterium]|nr:RluA family pseudouridine synthase [Lachnospiraceae bacterium]